MRLVESSSLASMGMLPSVVVLRTIRWADGGIPVTVSSFALSVLIDHDGVMRRSADEFSETTRSGTSAIVPVIDWSWRCNALYRALTLPETTLFSEIPKLAVRPRKAPSLHACDENRGLGAIRQFVGNRLV